MAVSIKKGLGLVLLITILIPTTAQAERKTHWLRGAVIGGSAGLVTGLAIDGFIMGINAACDSNNCSGTSTGVYVGIPLAWTAVGAGVGALVGMAFKRKTSEKNLQVVPVADPQSGTTGLMIQGSF